MKFYYFSSLSRLFFIAVSFFIAASSPAMAFDCEKFSLGFGTGENQVMYYNSAIKDFQEPYSMGPSDFCIFNKNMIAIVDTFNNSVKIFDDSSKLLETINVADIVKKEKITDEIVLTSIAFVKYDEKGSEFYVSDAINSKIYHIAAKKLVKSFGARGDKPFELMQLEQIFWAGSDKIAACDYALNKISVFSKFGNNISEHDWNLCGGVSDGKYIYSLARHDNATFSLYRSDIETGHIQSAFQIQVPGFRLAKLAGRDKFGNFIAAFFDDSIQSGLMKQSKNEFAAGYYTIALISANGQIRDSKVFPVSVPLGNEFYYDSSDDTLYCQNYNSDLAPAGKYKISSIRFDASFSDKALKTQPNEITPLKANITKIEYGAGANKLLGSFDQITEKLPILRTDAAGYLYILDRIEGKIIRVDASFSAIKTIEISKNIKKDNEKKEGYDFCDLYALNSSEIYLLDSRNNEFYYIKAIEARPGAEASYDVKLYDFADDGAERYDRISANALGEVMLYSTFDGSVIVFDKNGGEKNSLEGISESCFFVMHNSDVMALSQNEISGEVKIKYMDFYRNSMNRFEKPIAINAGPGYVSAAKIIGADANTNVFLTYFSSGVQKIAIFSVTGDKICDFDFIMPNLSGYLSSSLAIGADGTLYAGVPGASKYFIVKIPYASLIDYIQNVYSKKK